MTVFKRLQQLALRIRQWGIVVTLKHYIRKTARMVSLNYRLNPDQLEKQYGVFLPAYLLFDFTRMCLDRLFQGIDGLLNSHQAINQSLVRYGNYQLITDGLSDTSIVYSFGISNNILFDEEIANAHMLTVHMFDPTSPAIEYFASKQQLQHNLIFEPIGLWIETGTVRFYVDRSQKHGNFSITNFFRTDDYEEAECMTLTDIMAKKNHTHIDVLKVDIEGAAMPVLDQMLDGEIRPVQIVGELERPMLVFGASIIEVWRFIQQKRNLFNKLRSAGYQITTFDTSEFIAVYSV